MSQEIQRGGPGQPARATSKDTTNNHPQSTAATGSRMVSWIPVAEFIAQALAQANTPPTAGTPAWCALADGDPQKLLAVAVMGVSRVITLDDEQTALADASKAIAASTDWRAVSREIQQRRQCAARIERKASA